MFVPFFHLCPSLNVSGVAVSAVSPFSDSRFFVSHGFSPFCPARVHRFSLSPFTRVCVPSSSFRRRFSVFPFSYFPFFNCSSIHMFFCYAVLRFSLPFFACSSFRVFPFLSCFVPSCLLYSFSFFASVFVWRFFFSLGRSVRSSSFYKWLRSFIPCFLCV